MWGIAQVSRDMLQNGVSYECVCVKLSTKLSTKGGVSHQVLTSLKKYRARWGIAAIVSQYRSDMGATKPPRGTKISQPFFGPSPRNCSRGFAKGWFPKGWFWRVFPQNENRNEGFPWNENRNEGTFACSPGTKTGTRVRSPKPPFYETALLSPSDVRASLAIRRLFLVGAVNRPRKRKRTNRENPRRVPGQIGKIPKKRTKKDKKSPDRETPPFETPPL